MPSDRNQFRESLQLVLEGDPAAAEAFFATYRNLIRILATGLVRQRLLVRFDESDVAQ